jgi:hypothetical protein
MTTTNNIPLDTNILNTHFIDNVQVSTTQKTNINSENIQCYHNDHELQEIFNDEKGELENVDLSNQDSNILYMVNIKDFAYDVSDPRHFGIYDEEYTDEEEEDESGYDDDDYDDGNDGAENVGTTEYQDYYETGNLDAQGVRNHHTNDEYNAESNDLYSSNEGTNNEILHAIALYSFVPENSNELSLVPDQLLIINYECGDGWLVAHDPVSGQTGLVPSEYIRMLDVGPIDEQYESGSCEEFAEDAKDAHRFMPEILCDDNAHVPTESLDKLTI